MICATCGCEQFVGAQFCRQCGAAARMTAPPSAAGWTLSPAGGYGAQMMAIQRARVQENLQPLGIMWVLFGVYRVVTGILGALMIHHLVRFGVFSSGPAFLPGLMSSLMPALATISILMGVGSVVVGIQLLTRQAPARILAIVFGVLVLAKLPIGTALGIYTLWVLAPRASGDEWTRMAAKSA